MSPATPGLAAGRSGPCCGRGWPGHFGDLRPCPCGRRGQVFDDPAVGGEIAALERQTLWSWPAPWMKYDGATGGVEARPPVV